MQARMHTHRHKPLTHSHEFLRTRCGGAEDLSAGQPSHAEVGRVGAGVQQGAVKGHFFGAGVTNRGIVPRYVNQLGQSHGSHPANGR